MSDKESETIRQKVERHFSQYPIRRYGKGQTVFRPGDDVDEVLYLLEGTVVEYDISPNGSEVVVNIFKPGAFFPMSMAMNPSASQYFFEANSSVAVRVSPASQAIDFLHQNPDVTYDLLRRVYHGTDGIIRRMAHLMGGSARSRLLFELINSAHRFGMRDADGSLHLELSENDMAKRSGLSRETVNRAMREFKEAGWVRVAQDGIVVNSVTDLEEAIGIDL